MASEEITFKGSSNRCTKGRRVGTNIDPQWRRIISSAVNCEWDVASPFNCDFFGSLENQMRELWCGTGLTPMSNVMLNGVAFHRAWRFVAYLQGISYTVHRKKKCPHQMSVSMFWNFWFRSVLWWNFTSAQFAMIGPKYVISFKPSEVVF